MYRQMNHLSLVARNNSHYVALAVKLMTNPSFHHDHTIQVGRKFASEIHKNGKVAEEWTSFIRKAIRSVFL